MVDMARRGLLTGLISFAVAAPAIIRPGVLMPVRVIPVPLVSFQMFDGVKWVATSEYFKPADPREFVDVMGEMRRALVQEHPWNRYPVGIIGRDVRFVITKEAEKIASEQGYVAEAAFGNMMRVCHVPVEVAV